MFQQSLKLQEGFRTAAILKGLPKESSVCMCYELSRFARPEERTQLEAEKPSETKTLRSELNLTRTLAAEVDQSYETKTQKETKPEGVKPIRNLAQENPWPADLHGFSTAVHIQTHTFNLNPTTLNPRAGKRVQNPSPGLSPLHGRRTSSRSGPFREIEGSLVLFSSRFHEAKCHAILKTLISIIRFLFILEKERKGVQGL